MQTEPYHQCKTCGRLCRSLISISSPLRSEWYCQMCHASYAMKETDAKYFIRAKQEALKARMARPQ